MEKEGKRQHHPLSSSATTVPLPFSSLVPPVLYLSRRSSLFPPSSSDFGPNSLLSVVSPRGCFVSLSTCQNWWAR